ncbi:MAG: hypothetical protein H7Y20_07740 [Bryobacteraceae bacterium]|nr:hypothetical protein [Bryobacteraceae bacterium]
MASMTVTATKTKAIIFVNASSGFDEKEGAPKKLEQWFEESGIDCDVDYVKKGVNLAEKSREAVAAGHSIVVAGGGDGTLSATASGLVGTDVAFGVLPVGTLNHFARDLNIPLDMEAAAKVICAGHSTYVDVAEVNGKTFLNNSIIGLYPVFRSLRAEQERKGMPRRIALWWAAIAAFRRFPFFNIKLWVDGREVVRRTPYMLIANNEHAMEGWQLGLRKGGMTQGKLWIYIMRPKTRLSLLWMIIKMIFGQFRGSSHFEMFTAKEMWVDTRSRRLGVALDGEMRVMETPLRYRCLPASLKVIVPAQ